MRIDATIRDQSQTRTPPPRPMSAAAAGCPGGIVVKTAKGGKPNFKDARAAISFVRREQVPLPPR
jgi:hypothetical protein